jgi:hypothetical protein
LYFLRLQSSWSQQQCSVDRRGNRYWPKAVKNTSKKGIRPAA